MSDKPLTHFLHDSPLVCLLFFQGNLKAVEQAYRNVFGDAQTQALNASASPVAANSHSELNHVCVQHVGCDWISCFHQVGPMNETDCSMAESLTRELAKAGGLFRLAALARFSPLTCEAFDQEGRATKYDLVSDRAFDCSLVDEFADLASEYGVSVTSHRAQDSFNDYDELLNKFNISFSQIAVEGDSFRVIQESLNRKKVVQVMRVQV